MNADDFARRHPRLARDLDVTLLGAQSRIRRESSLGPVWTGEMVRMAVAAGFYVGAGVVGLLWLLHSDASRWWLLVPGLFIPAVISASREEITHARHALDTRTPRRPTLAPTPTRTATDWCPSCAWDAGTCHYLDPATGQQCCAVCGTALIARPGGEPR